jgi:hypothetical protein
MAKKSVEKSEDKVNFYGKVAKFPKNTKAKNAFNFLENIKISKQKLWYYIIEKDNITTEGLPDTELQMIKYNNKKGVNCSKFLQDLKIYYSKDERMTSIIEKLIIDGDQNYSIIRNIPDLEIDGVKVISIITKDIIKVLYH